MLFKLLVIFVALSPLPLGANRPWAWSLFALVFAIIGLIFFILIGFKKYRWDIVIKPLKYPLCLMSIPVLWSLVQISPWIPDTWAHPFWHLASTHLTIAVTPRISLNPAETLTALMKLLSYLLVFFLSMQFNRQRSNAEFTFTVIAYSGFIYALYGLIIFFGQYQTVLWLEAAYKTDVSSTFINRNSYATYAGLTLLCWFPSLLKRLNDSLIYGLRGHYGRQYFIENFLLHAWLPIIMSFSIFTALFLSHSRGGFLSTLLALIAFLTCALAAGKFKTHRGLLLSCVIIGMFSLSFWQSSNKLLERMDKISLEHNDRLDAYTILQSAIADNRWLGVGYGTFPDSFRLYRDESIRGFYDKAHNTYLENLFELGIIPAIAMLSAIVWVTIICCRGIWLRKRDWYYPGIGFSASILVGVHALVDFSLQMPAIAYTYALIIGAAYAQSLPRALRNIH